MQEPVEAQVALAEHRRRCQVHDGLFVEPLRNPHARTDAIEIDRQRANADARQLCDAFGRAHQPRDLVLGPQSQSEPLADVAAAGDEDMTTMGLHGLEILDPDYGYDLNFSYS